MHSIKEKKFILAILEVSVHGWLAQKEKRGRKTCRLAYGRKVTHIMAARTREWE